MTRLAMKFGGTSVGSPSAIQQTVDIIKDSLSNGDQVVVVVSAMSGVTDLLLKSADAAVETDKWTYTSINDEIRNKHHAVIEQLIQSAEGTPSHPT